MKNWKINSWRKYPVKHQPIYDDEKELDVVLNKLKTFPPLVFAGETRHLKNQLSEVVDGKAFLLQGGDCAESFAEFHPDEIPQNSLHNLLLVKEKLYHQQLPIIDFLNVEFHLQKLKVEKFLTCLEQRLIPFHHHI